MSKHRLLPHGRSLSAARGFSLIELMISLFIGMGLIVAMGLISNKFETAKREQGASADMSSTAAFLSFDLDRQIRSAGSGFTTFADATYGCQLTASRKGAQILPSTADFPAPFASVPKDVRLVPVVAYGGSTASSPDVLQIMTATGGMGEVPTTLRTKSVETNLFRVNSTLGLQKDDLLLISETNRPCMLEQVASTNDDAVNLAGDYYASVINGEALNDRATSNTARAFLMGNATNGNPPRLFMLGINSSQQLVRYDLLAFTNAATSATTPVPLADGVVDMRVLYGLDTNGDGMIDGWVSPRDAAYKADLVRTDSAIAKRIIAARVALVLRSQQIEDLASGASDAQGTTATTRSTFYVAPASMVMFSNMSTDLQSTYTVTDRQRRHLVVEFTVPLRNLISTLRTNTPS